MMAVVSLAHIDVDEKGVARIAGSRIKVRLLIEQHLFWKQTPEQLHESYPHLSLDAIYDAFAYYYANRESMDAEIESVKTLVEKMKEEAGPSPVAERLCREGHLR